MNIEHFKQSLKLSMSVSDVERKSAEKYLEVVQKDDAFISVIFSILTDKNDIEIKMAAGIIFKNFIKKNWTVDENNDDRISISQRDLIKNNIIHLMLISEPVVEKQLSDAVGIIGRQDFPEKWPSMLPQLVEKINEGNFMLINIVLRTCNSLFKRYRKDSRSDSLWLGIKEVIDKLAVPLTQLVQHTLSLISQHSQDANALSVLWSSMLLITKIFRSLNCQDLPEYFEDNMQVWMTTFHLVLQSTDNNNASGGDEPTMIDKVKAQICQIVSLYATKYMEEFSDFVKVFIEDVYTIMLATNSSRQYDSLVSSALDFLSIVASRRQHRPIFDSVIDMQQLCQRIILPNIEFQLSDQETFEDIPEEYIARDIEGSNAHTRRKSSCELIKSLNANQEGEASAVMNIGQYIEQLLVNYALNPTNNWKMKDSALFLVTALANKGETDRCGVTVTSELIDVRSFYQRHILPELGSIDGHVVIKADSIKYLMTFRSLIGHEELRVAINHLTKFVTSPSTVVHSYACAAINKLLMVKEDNAKSLVAVIRDTHINVPSTFISSMCATMTIDGSQDNIYAIQAVTRALSTLQSLAVPVIENLVPFLINKLTLVVKNPRKPLFNHFLIESLALCIKLFCATNRAAVTHFESVLCPIFNDVLRNDIVEFVPYVFQLFSLMLDQQTQVTGPYIELFPFLVHPDLWANTGNVPSLIRLLVSYLEKADGSIIADKLDSLVSIFIRLNTSRALDSFAFNLMTAVMLYVPRTHTDKYMKQILISIFQRLSKNKTIKYQRGFILFLANLVHIYPVNEIIAMINSIQSNLFQMVLDSVIVPTITLVTDSLDKKIVAMGMIKMISESNEILVGTYARYWPIILTKIVEVLTTYDPLLLKESEAHFVDIADRNVTSMNQLIFVAKKTIDPSVTLGDPRVYLGETLKQLSSSNGQQMAMLYQSLDASVVQSMQQLLATVNVI